jgi:RecA-family ATPase
MVRPAGCPLPQSRRLERQALEFGARCLILDAATNFYGGDEIRRRQVNAFLRLLHKLAIKIDGSIILLAHPSAAGLSTGTGLSGSTHWHNGVRSRLYFTRMTGDDADPDERELTRLKANYAGTGDVLRLHWQKGGFIAIDEPAGIDRAALSAKADRVFVSLLTSTYANGAWASASPSARNYAPTAFAKHPDREHIAKAHFETAMHRLLRADRIKVETYGPPSQNKRRLAVA